MSIQNKVKKIIKNLCGAEKVHVKETLIGDLAMDSLSMVTLLVELEDSFKITFTESDMNPFDLTTVADVIALVQKYEEAAHG